MLDTGEDESKKVYAGKLDDLRALVTPIQARAKEWQELPAAEEALRTCIVRFRKVTDLAKTKVGDLDQDDVQYHRISVRVCVCMYVCVYIFQFTSVLQCR